MKIKSLIVFACSVFLIAFSACNDELSTLGFDVRPPEDVVSVKIDTFAVSSSTFKVDSICAKSIYGMLGYFEDPVFGSLKSDYMCQFYCPEGQTFPDLVIDNKVDSVDVIVFYQVFKGDASAPMQLSVFKADKPLDMNFYTNVNPADYCDLSKPLGTQAYTASNIGMRDSTSSSGTAKYLRIRLPEDIGNDILNKSRTDNILASREDFNKYFHGLYLTTTFGTGSIIEVLGTNLNIYFNYQATRKYTENNIEKDSLYTTTGRMTFNTTKEVIQLNRFKNANIDKLLIPNEIENYIKTPAGVFTEIDIPIGEINSIINPNEPTHITNGVSFYVKAYATPQDSKYPLPAPDNMMIILADEYHDFFHSYKQPENITSFRATYIARYDTTNLVYRFNNLAPLIKEINKKDNPGTTVKAYLVPVSISYDANGTTVTSIGHYLKPSAVRIRKDDGNMCFKIIHSKF